MPTHTDGPRVDAATQAHVRRTDVKEVRAGMTQTAAAGTFGVSVRAVNKWMAADKTGGLRALAAKPRGRPLGAGRLSAAQATKIRQQILDKMPDQLKLGIYLWTRAAVVALIAREYQVAVSLTTVGRYLKV
jgi:transposase